jgi:serine protease Do
MKYALTILFLLVFLSLQCQSLSPSRVAKIKSATVQIIVPSLNSAGTGFFIDKLGTVATCWHVLDPNLSGSVENVPYTYIRFSNGDTVEVVVSKQMKSFGHDKGLVNDFCLLVAVNPIKEIFDFYKLGNFDIIQEGQEVYTCGYPLGYPLQFISKGIISTKYSNEENVFFKNNKRVAIPREEALIDMTMNKGNSGGAIVKVGEKIEDDEVIGIADFIVNPLGNRADSLVKSLQKVSGIMSLSATDALGKTTSVDPSQTSAIFGEAIASQSIGISGCISANYLREAALGIWK